MSLVGPTCSACWCSGLVCMVGTEKARMRMSVLSQKTSAWKGLVGLSYWRSAKQILKIHERGTQRKKNFRREEVCKCLKYFLVQRKACVKCILEVTLMEVAGLRLLTRLWVTMAHATLQFDHCYTARGEDLEYYVMLSSWGVCLKAVGGCSDAWYPVCAMLGSSHFSETRCLIY